MHGSNLTASIILGMGVFEYIGVLISVIMGLAITHLAVGASKLLQNRRTAHPYLPHAIWTLNTLVHTLMVWWGMFWWSGLEQWSAYQYLGITLYAVTLFLMSAMLYPYDMERDIDVETYFNDNRVWFFGLMLLAWLLDVAETFGKQAVGLRDVPPRYLVLVGAMVTLSSIGLVSANRQVHRALPIAWLLLISAFISLRDVRLIDA
jgi:CDP-diglyceride synthetase